MTERISNIKYTLNHKKAFLKVEKQLLNKNTLRGYLHDTDKLFMYLFLSKNQAHKIHRKIARHHVNSRRKTYTDYVEMVIDWECVRFTKPDKPLNARETLYKYYPQLKGQILPILNKYNL